MQTEFLCADVVDLSSLGDVSFDFVYTGGHVAVWVSDLRRYYSKAARILKRGGRLVVSEYRPFRRVWRRASDRLELGFDYFDRGHRSFSAPTCFMADQPIAAVLAASCELIHIEVFGDACEQWEGAPMTGLPAAFLLIGQRDANR